MSSYTTGVPQATDRIADTQVPIQTNFNLINTDFGVDHYSFSPPGLSKQPSPSANIGYHYQVTLPNNSASPPNTGTAGKGVMFGGQNAADTTNKCYPYWLHDGSSLQYPMAPIRAFAVVTVAFTGGGSFSSFTTKQSFGCTATPVTRVSQGVYTVNLNPAAPLGLVSNYYYGIIATPLFTTTSNARIVTVTAQTTTSFTLTFIRFVDNTIQDPDGFYVAAIQF